MLDMRGSRWVDPFDGLPSALEDDLPAVLDEVVRLLRADWPAYAAFLAEEREQVAVAGHGAVRRIVETAERAWLAGRAVSLSDGVVDGDLELFAELGRRQWRSSAALTDLLSAYQVGARVAWRVVSQTAVERGVPADCVALLAESVFVLVAELSSTSTRGYVEEQSRAVAGRERARSDLAELLLSDRCDRALLDATARRAGWVLPGCMAVVLLASGEDAQVARLCAADASWLPLRHRDAVGVLVPDPDAPGRRERLARALRATGAVVGRAVPLDQLPASLRIAQLALRLTAEGRLQGDPVFADDHLDALVVHSDARLLEALQARVLAPLADVPPDTRQRLEETLLSWLQHMGDRQQVANELYVHRQTVRYRLRQLAELFGDGLEDPAVRRQLLLVLAWRAGPRPPAAGTAGSPELTAPAAAR